MYYIHLMSMFCPLLKDYTTYNTLIARGLSMGFLSTKPIAYKKNITNLYIHNNGISQQYKSSCVAVAAV